MSSFPPLSNYLNSNSYLNQHLSGFKKKGVISSSSVLYISVKISVTAWVIAFLSLGGIFEFAFITAS